jgi:6-phosphofructokinase 1
LIPEIHTPLEDVADCLSDAYLRGKAHGIILVAEGYKPGTQAVLDYLDGRKEELGFSMRVTVLGHVQRGGSPTAYDRILATRLGCAASEGLLEGQSGVVAGMLGGQIAYTPLEEAVAALRPINERLYDIGRMMEL